MDEVPRVSNGALPDQMGPELTRDVELRVDFQRPGDVDAAIRALGGVIQLAIGGVSGACVVPGAGALQRAVRQDLQGRDGERGLELLEQRAKRGAHDSRADQYAV